MKFININKQKPQQNQIVLVKTGEKWLPYCTCEYIISKQNYFEEVSQGRMFWFEDEIVGWAPLEDIEKEPVYCKDCVNRYNELECPLAEQHDSYDEDDGWDYWYTYGASEEDSFYCAYGEKEENE